MPTHPLKLRNRSLLRSNGYNRILSAFPIWKGKSLLDGSNIMVCLSNITTKCNNEKIAFNGKVNPKSEERFDDVLQVWYLREDEAPQKVFNSKQKSVCGDCQHLKDRSCYVVWFQAPLAVWKAAKDKPVLPATLVKQLTKDMFIRLGAAGDPAAAPAWVSRMVSENARAVAGYTHQWHKVAPDSSLKDFVMASVDSPYQAQLAHELGWRTFRTEPENGKNWDAFRNEIECLAESDGYSCDRCGLCNGNRRNGKGKNIKIRVHGVHSGKYKQNDNKFYSIRRQNHK